MNILDALIVKISADTVDLERGAKRSAETVAKTRENFQATAKDILQSGRVAAEFFTRLRQEAVTLFAAFTGARTMRDFVRDVVGGANATEKLAAVLSTSARDIETFRGALIALGGSAEEADSTLATVSNDLQNWGLYGENISAVAAAFNEIGVNVLDANNRMRPFLESLRAAKGQIDAQHWDSQRIAQWGRRAQYSATTIQLLMKSRREFDQILSDAEQRATMSDDARKKLGAWSRDLAALKVQFKALGAEVVSYVAPAVKTATTYLQRLGDWLRKNPGVLRGFLEMPTQWLAELQTAFAPLLKAGGEFGAHLAKTLGSAWRLVGSIISGSNDDIRRDWRRLVGDLGIDLDNLKSIAVAIWAPVTKAWETFAAWAEARFGETGKQIITALEGAGLKIADLVKNNPEVVERIAILTAGLVGLRWAALGLTAASAALGGAIMTWAVPLLAVGAAFKFLIDNWDGIKGFIDEFSKAFSKGLGETGLSAEAMKPLVDMMEGLRKLITGDWNLGEDRWKAWGELLGGSVAKAVGHVAALINTLADAIDRLTGPLPQVSVTGQRSIQPRDAYDADTEKAIAAGGHDEVINKRYRERRDARYRDMQAREGQAGQSPAPNATQQRAAGAVDSATSRREKRQQGRNQLWDWLTGNRPAEPTSPPATEPSRPAEPNAPRDNVIRLPARAAGGPVEAGKTYIVGERGPEPFIPRTSGTILPAGSPLPTRAASNDDGSSRLLDLLGSFRDGLRTMLGGVSSAVTAAFNALINRLGGLRSSIDSLQEEISAAFAPGLQAIADLLDEIANILDPTRKPEKPEGGPDAGNGDGTGGQPGQEPKGGHAKLGNKEQLERARYTVEKLMAMGWTKEQAIGITANIQAESQFDPKAKGDGGHSHGIAQWDRNRQADFFKLYGKRILDATYDEQLEFLNHELRKGKERPAGEALKKATTSGQAAAVVSKQYERPAAVEEAARNRAALARLLERALPAPAPATPPATKPEPGTPPLNDYGREILRGIENQKNQPAPQTLPEKRSESEPAAWQQRREKLSAAVSSIVDSMTAMRTRMQEVGTAAERASIGAPQAAQMQRIANDNRSTATTTSNSNNSSTTNIRDVIIQTQATEAEGIAADFNERIRRRVENDRFNYGAA